MVDELPEAVLIELGRLTWSAIHLEDCTDAICHNVVHRAREDRTTIGPKIKAALKALSQWQDGGSEVDQIKDWLARAQLALEKRNALLHSVQSSSMSTFGRSAMRSVRCRRVTVPTTYVGWTLTSYEKSAPNSMPPRKTGKKPRCLPTSITPSSSAAICSRAASLPNQH